MEKAPKPSAASTTWFGRRETSMNLTKKADPLLPANTFTGAGRRVGITRTEGEKNKKENTVMDPGAKIPLPGRGR